MAIYAGFRAATADDLDFILEREADPTNSYIHCWDRETHQANIADSAYHYLIPEDAGGTRLGYAILLDNPNARIEWRRIVIAVPGKGTGKAFMADVLQYFRDLGKTTIWLDVYKNNTRARHVYEGLGFRETHREVSTGHLDTTLVFMEHHI